MSCSSKSEVDIQRLPVNSEEHIFNAWTVKYKTSHILHSKCSKHEGGCSEQFSEACLFCLYSKELQLPHMPDMVFANNLLQLIHKNGFQIEFNALDALKKVSNGKPPLKIACAQAWKETRQESGSLDEIRPFDWTFTSDYMGSLSGEHILEETTQRINMDKLKQREQILFYNDMTLFEDELHDNGIASCSVKIRVMPSSYFILLRFFLRVDGVLARINDTRLYHEFETSYILREFTSKEAKVSDLNVPPVMLIDPSEVAQLLPTVKFKYDKIILKLND